MFILGKILGPLVFPPGLFIVLALLALVLFLVKKCQKTASAIAAIDVVLIYLLSINTFSSLLITPLENKDSPISDAQDAKAIVMLGEDTKISPPNMGEGLPLRWRPKSERSTGLSYCSGLTCLSSIQEGLLSRSQPRGVKSRR